eukprot:GHVU01024871.1.p1 GENE.GHVU01024871.1~~GHVU01024871.1.p1  ORF type:complete len:161 (+),score=5.38 GHVU01024871.1:673-1155(+)
MKALAHIVYVRSSIGNHDTALFRYKTLCEPQEATDGAANTAQDDGTLYTCANNLAVAKACWDIQRIWLHCSSKLLQDSSQGSSNNLDLKIVANRLQIDASHVSSKNYTKLARKGYKHPRVRTPQGSGFETCKTDEGWAEAASLRALYRGNLHEHRIERPC